MSDDAKIYTLKARQNAVWNNGDAFTADDVVFNIRRMANAEVEGNSMAARLVALRDGESMQSAEDAVVKVDDFTVQLNLRVYAPSAARDASGKGLARRLRPPSRPRVIAPGPERTSGEISVENPHDPGTPVNIPFHAPYRFSYGSIKSLTKTVIELQTEDGVSGLGECADGDRSADVERLIGQDFRAIAAAPQNGRGMAYTPWGDVAGAKRVFGGIEMAMWDARGKTEGRSLAELLGGALFTEIPHTEYFSYRLPGPDHPGEATPTDIVRYCARMAEHHGARIFEGKVGTVSLSEEIETVREVRDAIGDCGLRLDANGAWTLPTARAALHRLEPFGVTWFEEPCESCEEMLAAMTAEDGRHVPGDGKHRARAAAERGGVEADAELATTLKSLGARL